MLFPCASVLLLIIDKNILSAYKKTKVGVTHYLFIALTMELISLAELPASPVGRQRTEPLPAHPDSCLAFPQPHQRAAIVSKLSVVPSSSHRVLPAVVLESAVSCNVNSKTKFYSRLF